MKIIFLGQGLHPESEKAIGSAVIDSLKDSTFHKFTCFVAFATQDGINILGQYLKKPNTHLSEVNIYVGIDLHLTSEEALKSLLELEANTNIFYTVSPMVFHPKLYLFEAKDKCRVILGSSNFTTSGLFTNVESAILADFDKSDPDGVQFLSEINDYYRDLLSGKDPNLLKLDKEIIEKLVSLKLVPSQLESDKLHKKRKLKGDLDKSEIKISELFPGRKIGKIPAHIKPPVTKKRKKAITYRFWIQTGSLTGGSGNQLDLSMGGPYDSTGSVSLFGIDSKNKSITKKIDLKYQGKIYKGNLIKFPLNTTGRTNGTWRMQMHGMADDGEKLTSICSKNFRHKILLFEKLGSDSYEITVMGEKLLQQMKSKSKWWDQNNTTRGKHFGILN